MTVYVDSSALLKRYLDEPDSDRFDDALSADPQWVTARHTRVEVRRNLARALEGRDLRAARAQFERDWERCDVVELDERTCEVAAGIAEATGARTLDALHLGAAQRAGGGALPVLTADLRQAGAARGLGWTVLGS
jgi:hypothetical protein